VEYLAASGAGDLDALRMHGRRVTQQMRDDWGQSLKLVQLAAQKRKLLAAFQRAQEELVQTPLLKLNTFNEDITLKLAGLMVDRVSDHPVELNALLDGAVQHSEKQVYDPMPTGVYAIDTALSGGVRKQEIVLLIAPEKGGKTTTLRQMLYEAGMSGNPMLQVAWDGGNATRHAIIYLGMHTASLCIQRGVPTLVQGYEEDALFWKNLALWLNNQNPNNATKALITPIVPQVETILKEAREELRALKKMGVFNIVDPQTTGYTAQRAASFIRKMHHHNGVVVVGIDHIGKFGDRSESRGVYDRVGETVQVFSQLPGSLPIALIMLSQMTSQGIRDVTNDDGDHQDWSAGTEGGRQSQQEADIAFQLKRNGDTISIRSKLARDGKSQGAWVEQKIHLGTGLFLTSNYQAVEGY
jgi:hypothetical protein